MLFDLFRYRPVGSLLPWWRTTFEVAKDGIRQLTEFGAPLVAFYWVLVGPFVDLFIFSQASTASFVDVLFVFVGRISGSERRSFPLNW